MSMRKLIIVPIIAVLAVSIVANSVMLVQQNSKLGEINTVIASVDAKLSSVRGDLSLLSRTTTLPFWATSPICKAI
jgi:preprotein translocase subunit SecG